jgi:hypothetical protein
VIARVVLIAALAFGAGVLPAGCASDPSQGYSMKPPYREDVKTIAVPIFDNATYAHGVGVELTDAIVKEINRSTPWRVTSLENADTTLRGTVTDTDLRKLTTNSDSGLVESLAVEITVSFEWKKIESGEVLVAKRNFRGARVFVPAQGAQERLEYGRSAAIDQLARDIVGMLRSSW